MLNRRVTIISQNPETLDSVQEYLSRFGAAATGVSRLKDISHGLDGTDVVLLFADDYPHEDVVSTLSAAVEKLCIVVTQDIDSLRGVHRSGSDVGTLVLLRRPVWGWMLLDVLRNESSDAGTDSESARDARRTTGARSSE